MEKYVAYVKDGGNKATDWVASHPHWALGLLLAAVLVPAGVLAP